MIDVVAAGHLCVDVIPQISRATAESETFLAPGRLSETGPMLLSTGGSVSNTGLALHKLGMNVRLAARLGGDRIGQLTLNLLADHDIVLVQHLAIRRDEPSSYTIVINPPGIDRTFLHCAGTNHTFGPDDIPWDMLRQTRLFHLGYPPLMRRLYADDGAELTEIYRRVKALDVTTSLDMAMPDPDGPSGAVDWRAVLTNALPHVDCFVPSAEELLFMLRRERYDALNRAVGVVGMLDAFTSKEIVSLGEEAQSLGARIVLLKLGHRGLYLRTTDALGDMGRGTPATPGEWISRELWAPCFRVEVAGTTGAGDATIAGFLAAVLRGQGPEQAITTAVAVGACNVETADATSGVRGWDETLARVRAGWEKLDAHVNDERWTWDATAQVWRA